jgi:signal transduction histidine kinase
MRSLYVGIVIAMVSTASLALLGFVMLSDHVEARYLEPVLEAMDQLELESARDAMQADGPSAAARYLSRLDRLFGTTHYLLDGSGRDVVSGGDMASVLPRSPAVQSRGFVHGRFIVAHRSPDGSYWLLSVGPQQGFRWTFLPYYLIALAVAAALCIMASVGVVAPVRRLTKVMERFGAGDLSARSGWRRADEIGRLGRSFDRMADRLARLLASERRLLEDVSHELRSPLARLTMAVKLARTSPDPAAALDRVERYVDRLTALTAEIVEMVRIEGDPQAQRWEAVDLTGLLGELVADCRAEAEPRACEFRVMARSLGSVSCDRELIRRAFENVLRNAVRFSPEGAPIDVELQEVSHWVTLTVRDRGPGVPDAALERIFEPFFRVEDARESDRGGIGLGLSIARRAVVLHGGRITARNAGPGLMVEIRLPRSRAT